MRHTFKLTKTGYLICNDKYIKMQDDKGPVNFFPPNKINLQGVSKNHNMVLMDSSISIPVSLVIRSLPINVEMLDLIRQKRLKEDPSQIEPIPNPSVKSKMVHTAQHNPFNKT